MRNGLIEEVKTGERKSTIIMFLAALKALEGKKVAILTSSPVLAERDSKRNKQFFEQIIIRIKIISIIYIVYSEAILTIIIFFEKISFGIVAYCAFLIKFISNSITFCT